MSDRARLRTLALVATAALTLAAGCTGMQSSSQMMPSPVETQPPAANSRALHQSATTPTGYTVTDLGAIAGDSTSQAGMGTLSYGRALNNSGQATGSSSNPTAATATLFSSGAAKNINTLGAEVSIGNAINDAGQVAGEETQSNDPCACFHAFLYSNGAMKNIENSSLFPNGSQAYGINKSGQIVGAGFPSGSGYPFHAFLYSGGKMIDLDPFNGYQSIARAINDSGQIIGSSTGDNTSKNPASATWLYANGTITSLSTSNSGYSINNNDKLPVSIVPATGRSTITARGPISEASPAQLRRLRLASTSRAKWWARRSSP